MWCVVQCNATQSLTASLSYALSLSLSQRASCCCFVRFFSLCVCVCSCARLLYWSWVPRSSWCDGKAVCAEWYDDVTLCYDCSLFSFTIYVIVSGCLPSIIHFFCLMDPEERYLTVESVHSLRALYVFMKIFVCTFQNDRSQEMLFKNVAIIKSFAKCGKSCCEKYSHCRVTLFARDVQF